MDPLSDVISLLKPISYVSSGLKAGGNWGIQFGPQTNLIKCYAVISGSCWLKIDKIKEPINLTQDDCFVLPSGKPFILASDMRQPLTQAADIFPAARNGGEVIINGGNDFFIVGSRFGIQEQHTQLITSMLPPIVHIENLSNKAALRSAVSLMMAELNTPQLGSDLIAQHLAHIMLIQALRLHVSTSPQNSPGLLAALADARLKHAITAMHDAPETRWTLQHLATLSGLSRSSFAARFKHKLGITPIEYLTQWRMILASDKLKNTSNSITNIALDLGYESESAFGAAFKRIVGCTPREVKRREAKNSKDEATGLNK